MDEQILRRRIGEISELVTVPSAARGPSKDGTYISHAPNIHLHGIEDLLSHIRLRAKYLVFDLEATRRENHYLRQMLQRKSSPGEGADPF